MNYFLAPLPSTPRNLLVSPKSQSPIAVAPISKNNNKDDETDSNQVSINQKNTKFINIINKNI